LRCLPQTLNPKPYTQTLKLICVQLIFWAARDAASEVYKYCVELQEDASIIYSVLQTIFSKQFSISVRNPLPLLLQVPVELPELDFTIPLYTACLSLLGFCLAVCAEGYCCSASADAHGDQRDGSYTQLAEAKSDPQDQDQQEQRPERNLQRVAQVKMEWTHDSSNLELQRSDQSSDASSEAEAQGKATCRLIVAVGVAALFGIATGTVINSIPKPIRGYRPATASHPKN